MSSIRRFIECPKWWRVQGVVSETRTAAALVLVQPTSDAACTISVVLFALRATVWNTVVVVDPAISDYEELHEVNRLHQTPGIRLLTTQPYPRVRSRNASTDPAK